MSEEYQEEDTTAIQNMLDALTASVPYRARHRVKRHGEFGFQFGEGTLARGVTVTLVDYGQQLWLKAISSRYQGNGYASKALQRICTLTDIYGVTLAGHPQPFNPDDQYANAEPHCLSTKELIAWYTKKFGFKPIYHSNHIEIERQPKPIKIATIGHVVFDTETRHQFVVLPQPETKTKTLCGNIFPTQIVNTYYPHLHLWKRDCKNCDRTATVLRRTPQA